MKRILFGLLIIAVLIMALSSCGILLGSGTPNYPDDGGNNDYPDDGGNYDDPIESTPCEQHNFVNWVCTECGENYYVYVGELEFWSNGDGTCSVWSNNTGIAHITIPSTSPDGDIVTSISDRAFSENHSVKQIIIHNTVSILIVIRAFV